MGAAHQRTSTPHPKMAAVADYGALVEQQRLEGTIARIRWGAVALALVLGPTFPSLSAAAVVGLGVAVAAYNLLVLRLSARAATVESHRRIGRTAVPIIPAR